MRLATVLEGDVPVAGLVDDRGVLPLPGWSVRRIAAGGLDALVEIQRWAERQPGPSWRRLQAVRLGPAVPDPPAIYTIGLNYRAPGDDDAMPERPLVYGKVPVSVAAHGAALTWDRSLTENVDAECELGVVVGVGGSIFGYTVINDVSSRDPWLDGDQWLLGKSMPGFCPVGPWVVTADALDPTALRLGCRIGGVAIQDGRTSDLRYAIDDILAYLRRHVTLLPGDLVATGTPPRLAGPLGPERHLEPGDVVTCWIDGIGELTTTIA
jgi:2-keto-4-pentenoate hydratase/2-oxohepta-3-ene-1,7-dioic acid hydratase in catechol pathway